MAARIKIVENNRKRAIFETTPRYDVLLDGKLFSELCYNMRGYIGYLPIPSQDRPGEFAKLDIGERPLSAFRKEVAAINRELKQLQPTLTPKA